MQDQPIQGRPVSGGSSSTHSEDIRDQRVVLTHVLVLHPTHLKVPDLVREIAGGSRDFTEGDRIERAVRIDWRRAPLLRGWPVAADEIRTSLRGVL
jgi:hypothetical protein